MGKHFLLFAALGLCCTQSFAQVKMTSSAAAVLEMPAGTASLPPFKLTSGTPVTTPVDGAIEYDNGHFWGTIGTTRYQLDQTTGALSGSYWKQGGNSYTATGVLGTNDAYDLNLRTSGSDKAKLSTAGNLIIGSSLTDNSNGKIQVSGGNIALDGDLSFQGVGSNLRFIRNGANTDIKMNIPGTGGVADWSFSNTGFANGQYAGLNVYNASLGGTHYILPNGLGMYLPGFGNGFGYVAPGSDANGKYMMFGIKASLLGTSPGHNTRIIAAEGGSGYGTNYNGGNVYIDGGIKGGSPARNGFVLIGTYNATKVGINQATPTYDLDVHGDTRTDNNLMVGNDGTLSHDLNVGHDAIVSSDLNVSHDANIGHDMVVGHDALVSNILTVTNGIAINTTLSGGLNINGLPYVLEIGGAAKAATGGTWDPSDMRYKKNIEELNGTKEQLFRLAPKSYEMRADEFKEMKFDSRRRFGFIAQEVEKVFPTLVNKDNNGYYAVNYIEFIPLLLQALKEEDAKVKDLEARLANGHVGTDDTRSTDFENQLNSLKNDNAALKAKLVDLENNLNACCANNHNGGTTGTSDTKPTGIQSTLDQNVPNPFNGETTIGFKIATAYSSAFIGIYDLNGREINKIIIKGDAAQVTVARGILQPGMYTYSLVVDNNLIDTKKMVVTN